MQNKQTVLWEKAARQKAAWFLKYHYAGISM
jgi:hypothetical protein